jgi:hypothetical protein
VTPAPTTTTGGAELGAVNFFADNEILHDPYDYLALLCATNARFASLTTTWRW